METSRTFDAGSLTSTLFKSPIKEQFEALERGETTAEDFDPLFTHFFNKQHKRAENFIPIISSVIDGISDKKILPEMASLLRDLRSVGIKTALLTNNFYADRARLSPTIPKGIENYFDVVVESCRAGMRKPEYAIYTHVCNLLKVKPEECALLDDLGANLKAAKAMGIFTIKVTSPLRATEDVRNMLSDLFEYPSNTRDCLPKERLPEEKLQKFLQKELALAECSPFIIRRFGHGQSNPTYYIEAGDTELVLRKKPVCPKHAYQSVSSNY
ncbi:unnamed protein product [Cylicostephanus goldi]|uniref:Uncharacterized protein n=1 Tax=Cylicostephanus goldi TaxID=71465 RepID=A0A3P7N0B1_CYLGO|nr:unnamed protein product [Cylicostephanus goldi]